MAFVPESDYLRRVQQYLHQWQIDTADANLG
jgi:hypothetical protein